MVLLYHYAAPGAMFLSPSDKGLSGVVHVLTADNIGAGNWALRTTFEYINYRDFYNPNLQNNRFRLFDTYFSFVTALGNVGELTLGTSARVAKFQALGGSPAYFTSGGDIHVGLKMGYMTGTGFGMALYGRGDFVSGLDDLTYDIRAFSGGGGLLISLDFLKMKDVPLRFHLNIGYYHNRREHLMNAGYYTGFADYVYSIFHDDAVDGGVALEVPTKYATPFVEYWTHQIIDADNDGDTNNNYDDSPQYLSLGVRMTPFRGFAVDVFYDQCLSQKIIFFYRYPPWKVGLGISYTFLPRIPKVEYVTVKAKPPEKPKGMIMIKVIDKKTKEPIKDAVIRFEKRSLPAIVTNGKGLARIAELPPANQYKAEIYAPGYKRVVARFISKKYKGKAKVSVVPLRPLKPPTAVLMGAVFSETGKPLAATIKFQTGGIKPIVTNPVSGGFRSEIPPGKHVVEISAMGYQPVTKEFVADKDSVIYLDIILTKLKPPKPPRLRRPPAPPPLRSR